MKYVVDILFRFASASFRRAGLALHTFVPDQRTALKRLIPWVILASTIAALASGYAVARMRLDLDFDRGRLQFGEKYPDWLQRPHFVVNSTVGWQDSGVRLQPGEEVCVEASGRVNLAINQIGNLSNRSKSLIVRYAEEDTSLADLREDYPVAELDSEATFRRRWHGPAGQEMTDSFLDETRILPLAPWGALLGVVAPGTSLSRGSLEDPLRLLDDLGITPSDVYQVGSGPTPITSSRGGTLLFIVNDAVTSDATSSPARSKEIHRALVNASGDIQGPLHAIAIGDIPTFFFSDNLGYFIAGIERGSC